MRAIAVAIMAAIAGGFAIAEQAIDHQISPSSAVIFVVLFVTAGLLAALGK